MSIHLAALYKFVYDGLAVKYRLADLVVRQLAVTSQRLEEIRPYTKVCLRFFVGQKNFLYFQYTRRFHTLSVRV